MTTGQVNVRMGEIAVSSGGERLVALGLGSCIGAALVDRGRGIAGLAHVMLPESDGAETSSPGRFADLAIPALLDGVLAAGARRGLIEAVIAGGAKMFGGSGGMDIGARNDVAVRAALAAARLPIAAADTRGQNGRTLRVAEDGCTITVRIVGGDDVELFGPGGAIREVAA